MKGTSGGSGESVYDGNGGKSLLDMVEPLDGTTKLDMMSN